MNDPIRLAIVVSHPIQYYAPWFAALAARSDLRVRVFYLWRPDDGHRPDPGFNRVIRWDLDLLAGYDHEFIPNVAPDPGTVRFNGLVNPQLPHRLRTWDPDAVLAFGYGWRSLLQLALTWRDCPLLLRGDTHRRGRERLPGWRRWLQRRATALLLRRYRAFASVGAAHTDFLLSHGVPAERIFSVPHCVDNRRWAEAAARAATEVHQFREGLGIPPGHRLILFAGKFEPKKRPDLLAESFVRAAIPNTVLLLVGDGPLRERLREQYRDVASIRWLSFQNQTEMPRVYAAADLSVLPSEGHDETWGLAVNESMACGVPCLVSDHVGCRPDLVLDGETGWSFPAGRADALTAALREALATLGEPAAAARIRAAVLRRIDRYSYDAASEGLLHALRTTLT